MKHEIIINEEKESIKDRLKDTKKLTQDEIEEILRYLMNIYGN